MPDDMPSTLSPAPTVGASGEQHLPVGGGYRLLQLLGRGQFGEVWHAAAAGGVEVAVKIITRPLKEEETQRELRILQKLRRLRHSFLIGLQAFYQFNDRLFIIQEYADGGDLERRLKACRAMGLLGIPTEELLRYMEEAAEALDYLHENRVHHRDIKPVNLLLLGRHVKLVDFGLARMLETQEAQTMSRAPCTPAYASPETFDNRLHRNSDQYSLACSYVQMRTGHLPYACKTPLEAMIAHVRELPDLTPLTEEERTVLLRAMAKKPSQRYPNCTDFVRALADALRPKGPPPEVVNTLGMRLVRIPSGAFTMGSPESDVGRDADEGPQRQVLISASFFLGVHTVTRGQFRKFVEATGYKTDAEKDGEGGWGFNLETGKFAGRDPKYTWRHVGFDQTDEHPVVNVSWNDARAFCAWLEQREGTKYRLPTEAEWEYCCRANTTTRFHSGEGEEGLVAVANVADDSAKKLFPSWACVKGDDGYVFTAPVGKYKANAFGLFDMHGNVWEWCQDGYDEDYYKGRPNPDHDPQGPDPFAGPFRVIRGGSFGSGARGVRAAYRSRFNPADRDYDVGFRVVCVR